MIEIPPTDNSVICSEPDCGNLCYWGTRNPQELRCVKCGKVMDTRDDLDEVDLKIVKPKRNIVRKQENG